MPDENSEKLNKLEKIYHIIEFEIENANNQINLSKKDNISFILFFFALIGLFVFIPADTFFYKWFVSGIWVLIIIMGVIAAVSFYISFFVLKGKFSKKKIVDINGNDRCEVCESSENCKNIDNLTWEKYSKKFRNSVILDQISLLYSASIYTSFLFFLSCMASYFYFTSLKDVDPSFQSDSWILILLMLILIAFILYFSLFFKSPSHLKKKDLKKYNSELSIFSIIILIFSAMIYIHGFYSKIPPFTEINNESQLSSLLIEHIEIIPSPPLSGLVLFYLIFIFVVLFEHFISSGYIGITNQKLEELFILKYKIDRYNLGISPEPNIKNVINNLLNLKIYPLTYISVYGIFTIPFPTIIGQCEDIVCLALEDQLMEEKEDMQN